MVFKKNLSRYYKITTSVGKSLYAEKLTADNVASSSYTRQIRHRYNNTNSGQTTATKGLMTFSTILGNVVMNLPAPEQARWRCN